MEIIKTIFWSKKAQTFYWVTLDGFIIVSVQQLQEFNYLWIPLLVALLAGITKWINKDLIQK